MKRLHPTISVVALIVLAILTFVIVCFWWFQPTSISASFEEVEQAANGFLIDTLHSSTFVPPPLRAPDGTSAGVLTNAGVFADTNNERQKAGSLPLTENDQLADMAEKKLQDMFANQYFEHTSPTGVGASDLAKEVGYNYIIIGENLALGNFKDDDALVAAWMASPGHRANILNTRYTEIGIAVGKDIFEGRETWIAVQEFGLPISACPQPSASMYTTITTNRDSVASMETELNTQKAAINAMNPKTGDSYDAAVDTYNALVRQYNAAVVNLKSEIAAYNAQVSTFNACAQISSTSTPAEAI